MKGYETVPYQELLAQNKALQNQISAIRDDVFNLQENVGTVNNEIGDLQATTIAIANAGMINLIDNGDFVFDDEGYNGATYAEKNDICANWYQRTQASSDWILSTLPATLSSQGLKNDNTLNTYWNKTSGYAQLGGGYVLGQKFFKSYFTAGNRVYVRFESAKKVGASIDAGVILRVSLWDNTTGQKKIIEGAVKALTATRQGTAGTFTRKYILEIATPSGTFYSNITTPAQVTDALSVDNNISPTTNYVEVSWTEVLEQTQYKLYRYDSEYNEWRIVATISNGATSFRDSGGRLGAIFTVPSTQINSKAIAEIKDFGSKVQESQNSTVLSIRVPSDYVFSNTDDGEQWLQIDLLKDDGTNSTTTEVPLGGIIIDKVGVSFANGKFLPSNKDQASNAPITVTTPTVSSGGGSGGSYIPPEGGGGYGDEVGCVLPHTIIMEYVPATDEVRYVRAKDVVIGMYLVSKKPNGEVSYSKVKSIFTGTTKIYYNIITEKYGYVLSCSASHPIIQDSQDIKGKFAFNIEKEYLDKNIAVLTSQNGTCFEQDFISVVEVIRKQTQIITFEMDDISATYISNNIVSHNLRAKEDFNFNF